MSHYLLLGVIVGMLCWHMYGRRMPFAVYAVTCLCFWLVLCVVLVVDFFSREGG
jgi:hypothetical protein